MYKARRVMLGIGLAILAAGAGVSGARDALPIVSASTQVQGSPVLAGGASATAAETALTGADYQKMLGRYCTGCHNDKAKVAGFSIQAMNAADLPANLNMWEKVLRRVSLGEMPPKGMPRPTREQLTTFVNWLGASLDANGMMHPDPGHIAVHRMNRTQYANAIRDLLDLDVDVSRELPADDSAYGFDNIADLLTISPTLIDRYVAIAGKVSRLATSQASRQAVVVDYRVPKDPQVQHFGIPAYLDRASDQLPLGSRGGGVFKFYAPYDATYVIQLYLNPGTVTERETRASNRVELRLPLKAGPRLIGASFRRPQALSETLIARKSVCASLGCTLPGDRPGLPGGKPVPLTLTLQVDGAPVQHFTVPSFATGPDVTQGFFPRDVVQISVNGPFDVTGSGDTPTRRRVYICQPARASAEQGCARKILTNLAHRAFRRPVGAADIDPLMKIYEGGLRDGGFDGGIGAALQALLVAPDFVMVRDDGAGRARPGGVQPISDLALATRLSLFLWSSIPDDELLRTAEAGRLRRPTVLEAQVRRMLADPKAERLTQNFAGQWLFLRRLDVQRPDHDTFPDFSQPLRVAMRTETETFFNGIIRENRSILDFLDADYTYLNERLARHYGIKGVYGDSFRRVNLDPATGRSGLLGQGAVLMATSYNNRTSVVLRGKWVLEQMLGAGPPPPPANVPALNDKKNGAHLTVREQMEMHRKNPVCASCHNKMDPLGISLENFNAVGEWRGKDAGKVLDVASVLPDGTPFSGPRGLQTILLARKDQFVDTFIETMMTYATGREMGASDRPWIRAIRYATAPSRYPMQDIILGVVRSPAFVAQKVPEPVAPPKPIAPSKIASR